MKIACIGTGVVGRAWALLFVRAGHAVSLYDAAPGLTAAALTWIDETQAPPDGRLTGAITLSTSIAEAVAGADYIQESVFEDEDLKRAVCREIDENATPPSIIASSTSEIIGSRFLADLAGAQRCLVAHPLNPPHLIPLVELCPTSRTAPWAIKRAREILTSVGQTPILLRKEISGFVANRLQVAVIAEAINLVATQICSPEDIDIAMRNGLALRWSIAGPFETGHLNADGGYGDYLTKYGAALRAIARDLDRDFAWSADLIAGIDAACRQAAAGASVREGQVLRDHRLARARAVLEEINAGRAAIAASAAAPAT